MRIFILISLTLLVIGCKTSSKSNSSYTDVDKRIFELISKLRQNPSDHPSAELLNELYTSRVDYYKNIQIHISGQLSVADRYLQISRSLEVPSRMYNEIISTPGAYKAVHNPWNPVSELTEAKNNAAREYYNQGLTYLSYNNRSYALKAYDLFQKTDKLIPGYMDVRSKMNEAQKLSVLNVVVKPVNYNNNSFTYWGFQNDFLQTQMVRDLNFSSFRNVRFYTDWEASLQRIQVEKIVDLQFINLYVAPLSSKTDTYQRTTQIQVGNTNSIPSKPVYQTVSATIYITTRTMYNNAALECRIYDRVSGSNTFYDRFPGSYNWSSKTATYKGDKRALNNDDLQILNASNSMNIPTRNEIANKLVNDCYSMLLTRIRSAVQFN